jgi:hypothetical protein
MSRRDFNTLIENVLSELESELESEWESELEGEALVGTDAGAFSCSGWEGDPQSFSIRAAQTFCSDVFNVTEFTPDSVRCTGQTCIVHCISTGGWPVFDINVDMSQVPGIVTVSGTGDPIRMRPQICSYRYSCDPTGSITFTRINCRLS